MKKGLLKSVSATLLLTFGLQLVLPLTAHALSTGPSQPEVQAFEPVGTTEMVDLFSGDFVYNIPLMDIDGYPINLSYHGGMNAEQEASWVGLGWSLNPGEVNRTVRGVPDDFNGDVVQKDLHMSTEHNFRGTAGMAVGAEFYGFDVNKYRLEVGASGSIYMNYNNYKGISTGVKIGLSADYKLSTGNPSNSIGFSPSLGVGSQSGVDLDASLRFEHSDNVKKNEDFISTGIGTSINSRTGMKAVTLNIGYGQKIGKDGEKVRRGPSSEGTFSTTVPIGIQNYVPVVTNATILNSYNIQLKFGAEIFGALPNIFASLGYSGMTYEPDGSRAAYGYMYLENAPDSKEGILDFIRDKDGIYNKTMQNLPMSSLAYDVYSVNGQGTGGSFRPFRNDIGTVYDPYITSENKAKSAAVEFGAGTQFEVGVDINVSENTVETGPWKTARFTGDKHGTLYEKLFFKQAGELTQNQQLTSGGLFANTRPLTITSNYTGDIYGRGNSNASITSSDGNTMSTMADGMTYTGTTTARAARANLITTMTAAEAQSPHRSTSPDIMSYGQNPINRSTSSGYPYAASTGAITHDNRISTISQLTADGRRFVYGIPAMNNITKDITFSSLNSGNITGGLIRMPALPTQADNTLYSDNYFSTSITPAYAHSFLLTEVLSSDYVDITGNGCSDDDIGGYVKLDYERKCKDYRWRAPAYNIHPDSLRTAHLDPGFQSDVYDDKASVSMGSREQWYVHTIQSKNLIAEFYTSPREDGQGMPETINGTYSTAIINSNPNESRSFKLDSIRLFNKNERIQSGVNGMPVAVPIKTVIFNYDYNLCKNTPNSSTTAGGGKLTLKNLYIRYGNSHKNLLSPYRFSYNTGATGNPDYSYENKDRWGNVNLMDPTGTGLSVNSNEFPYTSQKKYSAPNSDPATAYNLTSIILPSGGKISVEYESDDYAFVQDRRAMQMKKIEGLGDKPEFSSANELYNGDNQFNYVYFKRDVNAEFLNTNGAVPDTAQMRKIYLEGEQQLYYSAYVTIKGDKKEQVKGFGEIQEVGVCSNTTGGGYGSNAAYGYVKLKKVNSNSLDFSPITLYAMNFIKWNLNKIVYPGYNTANPLQVLNGFIQAVGEIGHMRHPLLTFLKRDICKNIDLNRSWIRLQSASLSKKGGGIRVKRLNIDDNWHDMTNSAAQDNTSYGREYDYTIDGAYGTISSGVASYEPLVGGDENPFRRPVPYTAAQNLTLPAVDFYQLEPLGENFYPGASVGYSSVKVHSIHIDKGKSSMSEEESLFYTAYDYPIRVEATDKDPHSSKYFSLIAEGLEEQATQGYSLFLNDMHGKPRAVNNYVVTSVVGGKAMTKDPVNSIKYFYNEEKPKKLSSLVKAFRVEGNNYVLRDLELGKESDMVYDSRQSYDETIDVGAAANLNVSGVTPFEIPFPSVFPSAHLDKTIFRSMVATKVIQQYGILKRVETMDHKALTSVENMVYDAESGNVLLSRTNNEFNDNEYMQKLPAYLGYEGMGPAYNNIGYKEDAVPGMYINKNRIGYIDINTLAGNNNYNVGDELLYTNGSTTDKLWITKKGNMSLAQYYGVNTNSTNATVWCPYVPGGTLQFTNTATTTTTNNSYTVNLDANTPLPLGNGSWWSLLFSNMTLNSVPAGNYNVTGSGITNPVNINLSAGEFCALHLYIVTGGEGQGVVLDKLSTPSSCFLELRPRAGSIYPITANNTGGSYWWSSQVPKSVSNFSLEVLRSGKRNMLGNTVQEIVAMDGPTSLNDGAHLDDFLLTKRIISASANTYTDDATPYENYDGSYLPPPNITNTSANVFENLNDYILGLKGNFRPKEQYVPYKEREYTAAHSRKDGTYTFSGTVNDQLFWMQQHSNISICDAKSFIQAAGAATVNVWKRTSTATKYDMFGNGVEEQDALNIYSAAQYGYNKRLPVAAATNARPETMMFEGFEDINSVVIPEFTASMFYSFRNPAMLNGATTAAVRPASAYFHTPFEQYFSYLSGGANNVGTLAGMLYYTTAATTPASTGVTISNDAHTGSHSLAVPAGTTSFTYPIKTALSNDVIGSFSMLRGDSYLVDMWVKTGTNPLPAIGIMAGSLSLGVLSNKGNPIEGWQLMETRINVPNTVNVSALTVLTLNITGAATLDDIRMMPYDANMKSFVYDTRNKNRLMAELDANHYATFYEYDQEGQLVRVKKETEKGIVTLSENRRAIQKQ